MSTWDCHKHVRCRQVGTKLSDAPRFPAIYFSEMPSTSSSIHLLKSSLGSERADRNFGFSGQVPPVEYHQQFHQAVFSQFAWTR